MEKKRTRHTRRTIPDYFVRAFAAVAQAVSQTLDLDQLLDTALAKVLEVMDLDGGVIYFIDTEASEIVLKARRGLPEDLVGAIGRVKVAEADIQRWTEQREPAFGFERMLDQTTLAGVEEIIKRVGAGSYVGTSLWSKEMLRGVMVVGSRAKRRFSPEELGLLDTIGNQIAGAIENAELFEQTRARAEELKVSEAKYKDLIEDMNDGYVVYRGDEGDTIAFANRKYGEILGYSVEEIIGQPAARFFPATEIEHLLELRTRVRGGDATLQRYETKMLTKTGEEVPVEVSFKLIEYEGWFASASIVRDITERKRAEEELRDSEERLRVLIENAPDAIWLHDLEAKFIDGNKKAEELVGYSKEELIGRSFLEVGLLPEEYLPKAAESLQRSINGEPAGPVEYELIRQDGSRVSVELMTIPVARRGGVEVIGIARDITERKRAEKELLRHTERVAVTAELTRIIISSLNIEDVYEAFIAGVKRLVDCEIASIALVEGDRLRFLAVSSAVETDAAPGVTILLKGSATEWVMKNKRTYNGTDLAQKRQFSTDEAQFRSGLRSAIYLPLFSRGEVIGTFSLASRRPNAYGKREQEILEELAGQIAVAIEKDRLYEEVKRRKEDLEMAYEQLVGTSRALERSKEELEDAYLKMARTLVLTLEARDPYTRGHSERVAQLSRQIAFEMNLRPEEVKKIETAARLHDLGKIGIPNGILLKPGPITPSERAEIQLHPRRGVDMLRFLGFLNGTLPMIEGHHERYDGGGYPNGRRAEEIPMGGRILAVADAYDAMTSARPYRPAMTSKQAIKILKEGAGTQWDPNVVEAFLRAFGQSLSEGENAD